MSGYPNGEREKEKREREREKISQTSQKFLDKESSPIQISNSNGNFEIIMGQEIVFEKENNCVPGLKRPDE